MFSKKTGRRATGLICVLYDVLQRQHRASEAFCRAARCSQVSILNLGAFLRTTKSWTISRLSFAHLNKHREVYGTLYRLPNGLIESCIDVEIFQLFAELAAEPSTATIAILRFYELDWER